MNTHTNPKEREITQFKRTLYKIPAYVIVCNAAGPLNPCGNNTDVV
jgi:hypothetical protein